MLVFFPYKKLPYIFSHTKKCYVIHAHKKLPYKKNVSVFSTHTKKYYVIHAKKLLVFFTIQKITMYCTHTKNCHTKNCHTFFPIQKITMQCTHTKNLLCILTHKKILHNTPYKKFSSIFSHTKKLLCSARTKNYHTKKLLAFFPIQKITMQCTHTKNLLVFFTIQKITSIFPIQKNYYTKNCYTKKSPYKIITIQNYFILFY